MTNKQKYIEFCKTEKDIPIFSKDWWLDTVCGKENWDVCLVEKGGQLVASMPYQYKKDGIFNLISMPHLTQTLGPYIKYPKGQKYYKRLSWEKEMMTSLIEQLPKYDSYNQSFQHSVTNWLPFYWQGFNQSTRYTYVLELNKDITNIWNNFSSSVRTKIKKAEKSLKIIESNDIKKFYKMVSKTFDRQNLITPYTFNFIEKLDKVSNAKNSRKILFAIDKNEEIHVAIYLVWDSKYIYLLSSGGDPKLRNSGAKNLLVWESIKYAHKNKLIFDFEGSMIENIENYNRSFGAVQKPYFQIYKTNSKLWRVKSLLDKVLKK